MSKLSRTEPTAGGDAPFAKKTDYADDAISLSTIESKCSDDETADTKEASVLTLNVQTETEHSVEAIISDTLGEEIATKDTAILIDEKESEVKSSLRSEEITLQNEEMPQSRSEEKVDNSLKLNARDDNATRISELEEEVRVRKCVEKADDDPERNESSQHDNEKRTKERDEYRRKLEEAETKLAALQASCEATNHDGTKDTLQRSVEQLRGQLAQTALMYEERNRVAMNQENQINALNNQVASLKEVVSITRDLLQIRNMEVKHLQTEVDSMEKKISEERDRHNVMINKMDTAMQLNADLKKEYETQLSLFQSLREKYGEKITLLTAEKRALETAASAPE